MKRRRQHFSSNAQPQLTWLRNSKGLAAGCAVRLLRRVCCIATCGSRGWIPDLRAAEDLIFIERCQSVARIGWAPQAVVRWQIQPTLKATFRRFALYSYHNVLAGRQRYWHYGIARKYFLALMIVILAAVHSRVWLFALVFAAVARAAKSIWNYDEQRRLAWVFNPARLFLVGVILEVVDLATFAGWGRAVWHKRKSMWALRQKLSSDRH
jgi:hypothetical protein